MTDFTNARVLKCPHCETPFCEPEGRLCDCCPECGEDYTLMGHEGVYICRNCNWCSEEPKHGAEIHGGRT